MPRVHVPPVRSTVLVVIIENVSKLTVAGSLEQIVSSLKSKEGPGETERSAKPKGPLPGRQAIMVKVPSGESPGQKVTPSSAPAPIVVPSGKNKQILPSAFPQPWVILPEI